MGSRGPCKNVTNCIKEYLAYFENISCESKVEEALESEEDKETTTTTTTITTITTSSLPFKSRSTTTETPTKERQPKVTPSESPIQAGTTQNWLVEEL